MPELNVNLPAFQAMLRAEYLYQHDPKRVGQYEKVVVFGAASLPSRALGFHVMTDRGAVFWRLPISALCSKPCDAMQLDLLQLWDCFSESITVTQFDWLKDLRAQVLLKDGTTEIGTYRMTFDWHGSSSADGAGEIGHKCAHLLELLTGQFVLQPNNRLLWSEPSFVTKPFKRNEKPDYKLIDRTYKAETGSKWRTSDDDRFFYDTSKD